MLDPDQPGGFEPPVNPIPPVVVLLTLAIVLVEGAFSLGAAGFVGGPTGIGWRVNGLNDYALNPRVWDELVLRGFANVDLAKRFVTYPFVHASFTQALFAAALLLALGKFVGEAFGGAAFYALIGAYTYAIWLRLGQMGENQLRAFQLIGFLLGLQLVFGAIFGAGAAWIAEIAAFAFGFAAATLLVPGGWAALLARLRQR